ncbi:MAG: hypothetical protein RLZZ300_1983 [Pseudomonadota bacterium]
MTAKRPIPSNLIAAIRASHLDGVRMALAAGADVNEADMHGHGGLPLRTACFEGDAAIVRELLQHGANPNAEASDGPGAALRLALRRGHPEIFALLRQHGALEPENAPAAEEAATASTPALAPETASAMGNSDGNLIEFTQSEIKYSKTVDYDLLENFGTDTRALSLELALLDAEEVPPIAWRTDKAKD